MKYRVLKIGDKYFPQYKSWWTFGWRYFKEYWFDSRDRAKSFTTECGAIDYCKKLIESEPKEKEETVWESNP